ncbi:MAG: PIN domain-containing protein [Chloroflexia bacterium]
MTTVGSVFVDTNVLLRATIAAMPLHREAADLVADQQSRGATLWISRQVLREYLAVVTRPQTFAVPLSAADAISRVQAFQSLFVVADDTVNVTTQLLLLLRDYPTGGKQVHDANIVATMLAYNIDTLITQNIDDMQRFSDKIAIIQLVAAVS